MPLTFITGNPNKAAYISSYCNLPVLHQAIDLPEIQSLDLEKIAEDKARRAFTVIGTPVLVEDVSLVFTALHELPGPLIKWFAGSIGNKGLCELLRTDSTRQAIAKVSYCLFEGQQAHFFIGECTGTISETPKGEEGFGWDSIFIPEGSTKTWAEMDPDEKHATSMRKPALEKLTEYIRKNPEII